ncbi:MAG: SDR family oxidoreductase [Acidobacteriota bacterium]
MKLFDLHDKIALVTGSSQGLGFAMAKGLGEAGATVVLNGRDPSKLEQARQSLLESKINVCACAFDVTVEEQVTRAVQRIEEEIGPISILVNNAGANLRGPLETYEAARWRQQMQLNLDAVFLMTRAVGTKMIGRRAGKIINVLSLMSEGGRPSTAPYAASKGAVKMLTKATAVEWAGYNIQVNAIGPGYFVTPLTAGLRADPEFDQWVRTRTPSGRWGCVEELAGAVIFFASPASDFITGQVLYVDGGWLAAL